MSIPGDRKYRNLTDGDRARIQRLYDSGLSVKLIAERFSLWPATVKRVLLEMGVPIDSSNARREP